MARLATLGGAVAGRLQASLFHARKQRAQRRDGSPTLAVDPQINGTATVGQELTADEGTWTGDPIAYTYVWRRDGAVIEGATEAAYTLVAEDEGAMIDVTVTAVNRLGSRSSTAEAVGPVAAA